MRMSQGGGRKLDHDSDDEDSDDEDGDRNGDGRPGSKYSSPLRKF
jgi:hypothetical protein